MKILTGAIVILLIGINTSIIFAQGYSNSPVLPEGTNPPVIITQVELDSPFKFLPDNDTCTSQHVFYPHHSCFTDLVPGHKVECLYFFGTTCQPLHQYTANTNKTCLSLSQDPMSYTGPQWFEAYNTLGKPVQLQYFDVKISSTAASGMSESGPYYSISTIDPHEKCAFAFYPVNQAMDFDPTNRTITLSYDYDEKHYAVSTPLLTDIYNDSRTWQFDGNNWVFANQNTITVPEFPLTIPVFLIGMISLITFYTIKTRKHMSSR